MPVAAADRILFDARAPKEATRPGGLGKMFDWRLLENLAFGVPFMLSGGLDAGNVAEALRITKAPGVDVSSGVERAPGAITQSALDANLLGQDGVETVGIFEHARIAEEGGDGNQQILDQLLQLVLAPAERQSGARVEELQGNKRKRK